MARQEKLVPPPPPVVMPDPYAQQLAMGEPPNEFDAAWDAAKPETTNEFDAAWDAQPAAAATLPPPIQVSQPISVGNTRQPLPTSIGSSKDKPVPKPTPKDPPKAPPAETNALKAAAMDALQGADAAVGGFFDAAQKLPGEAGKMAQGIIQQAKQRASEEQKQGFGATMAATAAGVPLGYLQLIQDSMNAFAGLPGTKSQLPPVRSVQQIEQLPGLRTLIAQLPASYGVAKTAGGMAAPIGGGGQKAANLAKEVLHGGAGGAAFGYVGSAGPQYQETGKVDLAQTIGPVIGNALFGAGLNTAMYGIGKGYKALTREKAPKVTTEVKGEVLPPAEKQKITLPDGTTFDSPEAALEAANLNPAIQQAVLDALSVEANRGSEATVKNPFELADKSEVSKFRKIVESELPAATSLEHLDDLTNQASSWMEKNVKGADLKKEIRQQISGLRADRKSRLELEALAQKTQEMNKAAEEARQGAPPLPQESPDVVYQREQATKKATEPPPEVYEPTPSEKLEADERTQYPDAYRIQEEPSGVGGVENRKYTLQELTDSQLESFGQTATQKSERNAAARGYLQEKARRSERLAKGQDQDWPAESTDVYTAEEAPAQVEQPKSPEAMTDDELKQVVANSSAETPEGIAAINDALAEMERRQPPAVEPTAAIEQPKAYEGDRFVVQPHPEKKYTFQMIDRETGDIQSTSKDRNQLERAAENFNAGKTKPGQGKKKIQEPEPELGADRSKTTQERLNDPAAVQAGKSLPEPVQRELLEAGDLKRDFQHKQNLLHSALVKFFKNFDLGIRKKMLGVDDNMKLQEYERSLYAKEGLQAPNNKSAQTDAVFSKETEPAGDYKFGKANTVKKQMAELERLFAEQKAADQAWTEALYSIRDRQASGELPSSVTVGEGDNAVNFRHTPKGEGGEIDAGIQRKVDTYKAELEAGISETDNPTMTDARTFAKNLTEAEQQALTKDLQNSTSLEEATAAIEKRQKGKKRVVRGARSQRGAANVAPVIGATIQAAEKKGGNVFVKSVKDVSEKALGVLRNTLDIVNDHNPVVHSKIWTNIAKETQLSRGMEFTPELEQAVKMATRLTDKEILSGKVGTDRKYTKDQRLAIEAELGKLNSKQKFFLAQRSALRKQSAKVIGDALAQIDEQYLSTDQMPDDLKIHYETMGQLKDALSGGAGSGVTSEGQILDQLTGAMYDYVFKWNPSFHALNLLDPLIVGSARTGFSRVIQAKQLLRDADVSKFIKSFQMRGPVEEFRAGLRKGGDTPKTGFGKVMKKISDIPDLPSESWNNQDMLAAGFILHGDKIGYKGGGKQFLKDLAAGKIEGEAGVKAWVDALQVLNDTTGAGAFGLNKDVVGRTKARFLIQFMSQPIRVARMMVDYANEGNAKGLLTLLGMTVAFGGRAAIPTEIQSVIEHLTPQIGHPIEDILDFFNIAKKVPVVGRDLSDKLRLQVLPVMNFRTNAAFEILSNAIRDLGSNEKRVQGLEALVLFLLARKYRIGGGTLMKAQREIGNVAEGEKKIYAFPEDTAASGIGHKIFGAKGQPPRGAQQNYGAGSALTNFLLPGYSPEVGDAIKGSRRASEHPGTPLKQMGLEPSTAIRGLLKKR